MKATAAYKMSKPTKLILAGIVDAEIRGKFKRAMISAELSAAIRPKTRRERQEADVEA
jgi:hypothetical protein